MMRLNKMALPILALGLTACASIGQPSVTPIVISECNPPPAALHQLPTKPSAPLTGYHQTIFSPTPQIMESGASN
ncbi:Uncharacterised protein [Yersinia pekkanenii]|uniref:Lipoprotein n=2 Tax=Yersinia pekkanenii TaxID=1288385 RepID=A0A0T9RNA0_9GAMM|nr:Uncharacterised protein [Yersinia pekkanenii]CRY69611.1 Uncharacterised protein [Yersinia pekkanenii]